MILKIHLEWDTLYFQTKFTPGVTQKINKNCNYSKSLKIKILYYFTGLFMSKSIFIPQLILSKYVPCIGKILTSVISRTSNTYLP